MFPDKNVFMYSRVFRFVLEIKNQKCLQVVEIVLKSQIGLSNPVRKGSKIK